jgi:hypothetical protein
MTSLEGTPLPAASGAHDTASELEPPLLAIEAGLVALGEALRAHDSTAIEQHANALHRALAQAIDRFKHAARDGQVPPSLRRRLASASGQVAAQRESLARATAALDRAIDVLLPRDAATLYSAQGGAERGLRGGVIQA